MDKESNRPRRNGIQRVAHRHHLKAAAKWEVVDLNSWIPEKQDPDLFALPTKNFIGKMSFFLWLGKFVGIEYG